DLLGPDWDAGEVVRRMRTHPEMTIGEAILDQRIVAGAGNVYKSEVCFLRGVDPATPVEAVDDLEGLVDLLHRLLFVNRERGDQVTTGDTRPGRARWVYGRGAQPCRRCGSRIVRTVEPGYGGERVTYRCPACQPATADRSR
ncbi:MAG TPA: DNA glycosylase, partial [Actinomycetota bacterium]|nr:DNA glycosylase [Actinomycetota bacterium]